MTTCGGEGTGWGWQEPKNNQVARVSPYRLAAHLTSAFVIYTGLLWTTLSVLHPLAAPAPAAAAAMRRARGLLLPVRCVKPLPPNPSPARTPRDFFVCEINRSLYGPHQTWSPRAFFVRAC